MKTKRFQTKELVTYRKSNTTREVYFDNLQDAIDFAKKEKEKHPRTKKLYGLVFDNENKVYHRI